MCYNEQKEIYANLSQDGIEIPVGRRFSAVCTELKKV